MTVATLDPAAPHGVRDLDGRLTAWLSGHGVHAVLVQSRAQIGISGLKLAEQRPPPQFELIQSAGIHGLSSTKGCLHKWMV